MRVTLSPAGRATQTAPSPTAIPMLGSLVPTVIGRPRTFPERASIRVTVPSPRCATQTLPFANRQVPLNRPGDLGGSTS